LQKKLKNQNSSIARNTISVVEVQSFPPSLGFRSSSEKNQPEKATKIFGGDICGVERRQKFKSMHKFLNISRF
jgi:hypothetical protein